MASPLLETLRGGHEGCGLSRWHFGFRLEPGQKTPLLLGVQAQGCALPRWPWPPSSSAHPCTTEVPSWPDFLIRGVSLWLVIYKISLAYCCAVLWGSSSATSRTRLCFGDGYSHVAVRSFEVTTWRSPSLVFMQAFWAAPDTNRGSAAE